MLARLLSILPIMLSASFGRVPTSRLLARTIVRLSLLEIINSTPATPRE
jgi:hypothetical protein